MVICADPNNIHTSVSPGETLTLTIKVTGGPGKVIVENKQIHVKPQIISRDETDFTVTILGGNPGDFILDHIILSSDNDNLEIPVTVWWEDQKYDVPTQTQNMPESTVMEEPIIESREAILAETTVPDHSEPRLFDGRVCRWCGQNIQYDSSLHMWLKHKDCHGPRVIISINKRLLKELFLGTRTLLSSLLEFFHVLFGK